MNWCQEVVHNIYIPFVQQHALHVRCPSRICVGASAVHGVCLTSRSADRLFWRQLPPVHRRYSVVRRHGRSKRQGSRRLMRLTRLPRQSPAALLLRGSTIATRCYPAHPLPRSTNSSGPKTFWLAWFSRLSIVPVPSLCYANCTACQ